MSRKLLTHILFFLACLFPLTASAEAISSNPLAVNIRPGSGELQKYFMKKYDLKDHGFYFDGAWLADVNDLFSGGIPNANRWTTNSSLLLEATLDTEKMNLWNGGMFNAQLLQFNGQSTNQEAGTIQGYNSLPAGAPFNRTELYQLWFRQALFNDKLIIRIGKVAPTIDFNNVTRPVPLENKDKIIPAVTSLLYTPIYVNTSMLGVLPGYYNSIYGVTINIVPVKQWYLSLGMYDGSLAQRVQTGLTGPHFNGSYFNIAETGFAWLLGKKDLPGTIGLGVWRQTGLILGSPSLSEHGANGYYLFGSQRLWYRNSKADNSGISGFYQFGRNSSTALPINKFLGGGLTFFGLVPNRIDDSIGVGTAYSWLNQRSFSSANELMFQGYYQAKIINGIYLEPALSFIPTPAAQPHLHAAWAWTLRAIVLF